ncbi:hypothetical protein GGR52DRAFT_567168 [Hypoxylon sp. FL1284]|nr:hypothetical protein GGR52DRAFT_567168 [Hypoxylon sp. FL1284]
MSTNETSPNGNGRSPSREAPKRKASSPQPDEDQSSQSPKRARLDVDPKKDRPTPAAASPTSKEPSKDRRATALQEEKKRGKRLFGGLLSTLSQTTSNSQLKRRQEVERRQQAKAHQQKAEDDKHREEKLAKLKAVRQVEQLKFDEQVMETKHSNMLAMARFLGTRSTPKIFYLPWDPTAEQQRIIKDQIREVEDTINKEVFDFMRYKEQRMKTLGIAAGSRTMEPKDTVGSKPEAERLTDLPQPNPTNQSSPHAAGKAGYDKEHDKADDVVIEEVEDTVIY